MSNIAVLIEDLWKHYTIGEIGVNTLGADLNRRWAQFRGREDPTLPVDFQNDKRQYGTKYWAIKELNLSVDQGEIIGILGANGAGKSTLLKLLSRITIPSKGRIRAKGRVASLLEVGTGFHYGLTGRENIYLNGAIMGMSKKVIDNRLDEIIEFSECEKFIDTPINRYSSGMVVRLGFSIAAHLDCELMIVDEVLAVGDQKFQEKCIAKMLSVREELGRTILFVTHNPEAARKLCTTGAFMIDGGLTKYDSIEEAIQQYWGTVDLSQNYRASFELNPESPTITKIEVDEKKCQAGLLSLNIDFVSPFPIKPIPTITVCTTDRRPLFSSNGLMHPTTYHDETMHRGTMRCEYHSLFINSNTYYLSCWLGAEGKEGFYDGKQFELKFHFKANEIPRYPGDFAAGPTSFPAQWTVEKS